MGSLLSGLGSFGSSLASGFGIGSGASSLPGLSKLFPAAKDTAGKMVGAGAGLPTDIQSPFYSPAPKPSVWSNVGNALGQYAGQQLRAQNPAASSFVDQFGRPKKTPLSEKEKKSAYELLQEMAVRGA